MIQPLIGRVASTIIRNITQHLLVHPPLVLCNSVIYFPSCKSCNYVNRMNSCTICWYRHRITLISQYMALVVAQFANFIINISRYCHLLKRRT